MGHNPKMLFFSKRKMAFFCWALKLISIPGRFPRAWPEPVVSGVTLFPQEALLVAKGVSRQLHSPFIPINFTKYLFLNKSFLLIQRFFYFCHSLFYICQFCCSLTFTGLKIESKKITKPAIPIPKIVLKEAPV